jgi:hypothetical protein
MNYKLDLEELIEIFTNQNISLFLFIPIWQFHFFENLSHQNLY